MTGSNSNSKRFLRFWLFSAILVVILIGSGQIVNAKVGPKICTELGDSSLGATGREDLYWKKNTLRVFFVDGNDYQRNKVTRFASEWSKYANVKFAVEANENASDIRVSFKSGGSWSYVGTDAEKHKNQATMNFGWFDEETTDLEFQRVILHEFGHALGLVHEHLSPVAEIKWNKPVVIKYYKDNFGWTENAVKQNVFEKYSENQVNHTKYDPASIMHYHIEASWTMDNYSVPWKTYLSDLDKSFIKEIYP
jgi:serralysin